MLALLKHDFYDCKNWGTAITAVPTESLQTMVTASQAQPEALPLSEKVLIYNSEIPITSMLIMVSHLSLTPKIIWLI